MTYTLIIALVLFAGYVSICDSISIQCSFAFRSYNTIGSIYQCDGTLITGGSSDNVTTISGSHQSGKSNSDVLGLYIRSQNLQYFPRNVEAFFPNLIAFNFVYNTMSSISHDHLAPFPYLQFLDMGYNNVNSLDSNLFANLNSMKVVSFSDNKITNIGHDLMLPILPNASRVNFLATTCIDKLATTAGQIDALRFSLLVSCPPTIGQIEDTLESRSNLITKVNTQVHSLVNRTDAIERSHSEMNGQVLNVTNTVAHLENKNLQLTDEISDLQQSNVELTDEVTSVTDEVTALTDEVTALTDEVTGLQQSNVELTDEMTDLQQSNVKLTDEVTELTNRNLQLESRIEFAIAIAGYLELRVAMLESIIESKLGLKIEEVISENEN